MIDDPLLTDNVMHKIHCIISSSSHLITYTTVSLLTKLLNNSCLLISTTSVSDVQVKCHVLWQCFDQCPLNYSQNTDGTTEQSCETTVTSHNVAVVADLTYNQTYILHLSCLYIEDYAGNKSSNVLCHLVLCSILYCDILQWCAM